MKKQYRIVVLPGEGIGIEVVEAALIVLRQVACLHNFDLQIDCGLIGKPALQRLGEYFPQETAQLCQNSDGIVLGAVSKGGLLELRQHFDFFANLRPVKTFDSLLDKSPLKANKLRGVDLLFIRELVSGIYFGKAHRGEDKRGAYGYHTMHYYDGEIRRIARIALQQAQTRRGLVTVAHKENALPYLPWSRLVREEAANFPNAIAEPMLVDNLAMQLVINPQQFDVILASNLYGDILSDLGGAIVGSIGMLGSASFNEAGFGLYEPIHGTAPDIAGKGIANPFGAIAAIILMLQQWGELAAAHSILIAQTRILAKGYRTLDLNPQGKEILVNTQEIVELLLQELV